MDKKSDKCMDIIERYFSGDLGEQGHKLLQECLDKDDRLMTEFQEGQQIKAAFEAMERDVSFPSEEVFERICDRTGANTADANTKGSLGPRRGFFDWLGGLFKSPGLAWGLCAAQAAVFVFAFFVLGSGRPHFETMSSSQVIQQRPVYNVIFRGDVRLSDLIQFLEKHHMKIINGPLGKGLFVVEMKKGKAISGPEKSRFLEFMQPAY